MSPWDLAAFGTSRRTGLSGHSTFDAHEGPRNGRGWICFSRSRYHVSSAQQGQPLDQGEGMHDMVLQCNSQSIKTVSVSQGQLVSSTARIRTRILCDKVSHAKV